MIASPAEAKKSSYRIHPVRLVTFGLLICVTLYVALVVIPNWRQIHYRATGYVTVDGSKFYLHSGDNYLTQLIVNEGEYEPTETKLVRQILKDGDVFIDVGANIGWYSVHAAKLVGEKGQVIAFEPEPNNLGLLRKNVQVNGLKNVVVDDRGLSSAAGSFKLFLEKDNLGMHSLVMEHGGQKYIDVQTIRFDDYWAGKGDIKLVKIDTEGAEGMILEGMRETLKNHKNIELIVEFAPYRLKKSGYDADELLKGLYKIGFKASVIDEEQKRIVEMGTPSVKDLHEFLPLDDSVTNLHFKR
ncbi:MAG: FkbM family methyltransferase [Planctomycetes bacterium]|nr:FkbM family methyltransferase [Planctomycetota bacterium]